MDDLPLLGRRVAWYYELSLEKGHIEGDCRIRMDRLSVRILESLHCHGRGHLSELRFPPLCDPNFTSIITVMGRFLLPHFHTGGFQNEGRGEIHRFIVTVCHKFYSKELSS
jgi:hypothetical protein